MTRERFAAQSLAEIVCRDKMGAGVSTEGAPLSAVAIKNEIGVLYDAEKKKAFDAAATEGPDGTRTVPWPKIEAYAKEHDERALDPRKCMYINLKAFKSARCWSAHYRSRSVSTVAITRGLPSC